MEFESGDTWWGSCATSPPAFTSTTEASQRQQRGEQQPPCSFNKHCLAVLCCLVCSSVEKEHMRRPLWPPLLHMHSWGCLWRSLFFGLNKLPTCWLCCKSNLLKSRQDNQVLLSCDNLYFCFLLSSIETKDDSVASFIGRINAAVSLHLWYLLYPHAGAYVGT